MNFKKYIAVMLLVLLSSESTIWAANSNDAVPLFSPKQLKIGMDNFRNYLDKVKRCLATGPCKREELMQVKKHGLFLLKLLAAVALVGLARWKVKKEVAKAPERSKRLVKWISQVVKKELLEQTLDILEVSADPMGDPEKIELKRLKDGIKAELKRNLKSAGAWTQEEFIVIMDDALKREYGPQTERTFRMKENLQAEFHDVVEGMVKAIAQEVKKLIDEFQGHLTKLLFAIPSQDEIQRRMKEVASDVAWVLPIDHDVVGIIEEMGRKLKDISPEKVKAIFENEDIRKSLVAFINKIGQETHILDFIKQLKDRGLSLDYLALQETRAGIPRKAKATLRFGEAPGEGESEESEESGDGSSISGEEEKKIAKPEKKAKGKAKGKLTSWRIGGAKKPKKGAKEESGSMEEGT